MEESSSFPAVPQQGETTQNEAGESSSYNSSPSYLSSPSSSLAASSSPSSSSDSSSSSSDSSASASCASSTSSSSLSTSSSSSRRISASSLPVLLPDSSLPFPSASLVRASVPLSSSLGRNSRSPASSPSAFVSLPPPLLSLSRQQPHVPLPVSDIDLYSPRNSASPLSSALTLPALSSPPPPPSSSGNANGDTALGLRPLSSLAISSPPSSSSSSSSSSSAPSSSSSLSSSYPTPSSFSSSSAAASVCFPATPTSSAPRSSRPNSSFLSAAPSSLSSSSACSSSSFSFSSAVSCVPSMPLHTACERERPLSPATLPPSFNSPLMHASVPASPLLPPPLLQSGQMQYSSPFSVASFVPANLHCSSSSLPGHPGTPGSFPHPLPRPRSSSSPSPSPPPSPSPHPSSPPPPSSPPRPSSPLPPSSPPRPSSPLPPSSPPRPSSPFLPASPSSSSAFAPSRFPSPPRPCFARPSSPLAFPSSRPLSPSRGLPPPVPAPRQPSPTAGVCTLPTGGRGLVTRVFAASAALSSSAISRLPVALTAGEAEQGEGDYGVEMEGEAGETGTSGRGPGAEKEQEMDMPASSVSAAMKRDSSSHSMPVQENGTDLKEPTVQRQSEGFASSSSPSFSSENDDSGANAESSETSQLKSQETTHDHRISSSSSSCSSSCLSSPCSAVDSSSLPPAGCAASPASSHPSPVSLSASSQLVVRPLVRHLSSEGVSEDEDGERKPAQAASRGKASGDTERTEDGDETREEAAEKKGDEAEKREKREDEPEKERHAEERALHKSMAKEPDDGVETPENEEQEGREDCEMQAVLEDAENVRRCAKEETTHNRQLKAETDEEMQKDSQRALGERAQERFKQNEGEENGEAPERDGKASLEGEDYQSSSSARKEEQVLDWRRGSREASAFEKSDSDKGHGRFNEAETQRAERSRKGQEAVEDREGPDERQKAGEESCRKTPGEKEKNFFLVVDGRLQASSFPEDIPSRKDESEGGREKDSAAVRNKAESRNSSHQERTALPLSGTAATLIHPSLPEKPVCAVFSPLEHPLREYIPTGHPPSSQRRPSLHLPHAPPSSSSSSSLSASMSSSLSSSSSVASSSSSSASSPSSASLASSAASSGSPSPWVTSPALLAAGAAVAERERLAELRRRAKLSESLKTQARRAAQKEAARLLLVAAERCSGASGAVPMPGTMAAEAAATARRLLAASRRVDEGESGRGGEERSDEAKRDGGKQKALLTLGRSRTRLTSPARTGHQHCLEAVTSPFGSPSSSASSSSSHASSSCAVRSPPDARSQKGDSSAGGCDAHGVQTAAREDGTRARSRDSLVKGRFSSPSFAHVAEGGSSLRQSQERIDELARQIESLRYERECVRSIKAVYAEACQIHAQQLHEMRRQRATTQRLLNDLLQRRCCFSEPIRDYELVYQGPRHTRATDQKTGNKELPSQDSSTSCAKEPFCWKPPSSSSSTSACAASFSSSCSSSSSSASSGSSSASSSSCSESSSSLSSACVSSRVSGGKSPKSPFAASSALRKSPSSPLCEGVGFASGSGHPKDLLWSSSWPAEPRRRDFSSGTGEEASFQGNLNAGRTCTQQSLNATVQSVCPSIVCAAPPGKASENERESRRSSGRVDDVAASVEAKPGAVHRRQDNEAEQRPPVRSLPFSSSSTLPSSSNEMLVDEDIDEDEERRGRDRTRRRSRNAREEEETLALNIIAVSLTPETRRKQTEHLAAIQIQ
ncbi:hypothetical protein TGP89_244726, partial [Toxoplasma gondii p89]